jgi:hypothetical protein
MRKNNKCRPESNNITNKWVCYLIKSEQKVVTNYKIITAKQAHLGHGRLKVSVVQRGLEPTTSDMWVWSVTAWTNLLGWPMAHNWLLIVGRGGGQYVG